jgi:basic membrane protein A and related proteins
MFKDRRRLIGLLFVLGLIAILALAACGDDGDEDEEPTDVPPTETPAEPTATDVPPEPSDLVDTAVSDDQFSTLVDAVEAAGLAEALKEGEYTIFAPNNEAFEAALAALDMDAAALLEDTDLLTPILQYHVVEGIYMAADLADGDTLTTLQGADITVSVDDDGNVVLNDEVNVIAADVEASNGVIHAIDAVLLPPEAPAVDDMGDDAAADDDMADDAAAADDDMADDAAADDDMADDAAADDDMADDAAADDDMGDDAAAEPMDILGTADAAGSFSLLVGAVDLAGLGDALSAEGPFTVFAPPDDALAAIPPDMMDSLMSDPDQLAAVLQYHVVEGKLMAADLADGDTLTTLQGEEIAVSVEDGTVMLNGDVQVVEADIDADNGVIHVIDGVLLPPSIAESFAPADDAAADDAAADDDMADDAAADDDMADDAAADDDMADDAAADDDMADDAAADDDMADDAAADDDMADDAAADDDMADDAAADDMGDDDMAAEPQIEAPDLIDCDEYDLSDMKIGLVTDIGQIDDKSFNQSSWEGVLAAEQCGATVDYIETQDPVDYMDNIAQFAGDDYDIVVTVGFALGEATLEAAQVYPDVYFIGVDQFQVEPVDNVIGLVFHEDQSGFLAGVLAARLSETGTIAAVLGTDQVPPVVAFKEGYEAGAAYANPDISIISTYHPGGLDQAFVDPEWGAATARQALDQDADVVFGAGGKTGNGALIEVANAVEDNPPPFCIGVDTDQWLTVPEAHPCLVSSAMKLLDQGVADIIVDIYEEEVEPGNFFGDAALAPYHDLAEQVPDEVKTELEEVAEGLTNGSIWTGYGEPPEGFEAEPADQAQLGADLGTIKVGTSAGWPPFEFVDDDGNYVGFDIDLMNAIADNQGFDVEWVDVPFDSLFASLEVGEFDAVIAATTITPEREEQANFSDIYFHASQRIAVAADSDIDSPDVLPGLVVGVQRGTTGEFIVADIEGVEVKAYDEVIAAFQALSNGDVDAVVADGPLAEEVIAANPDLDLKLVGEPFTDEYYGIAVRSGYPELLDAVNAGLDNVIADGTYAELHVKWFGAEPGPDFMPAE